MAVFRVGHVVSRLIGAALDLSRRFQPLSAVVHAAQNEQTNSVRHAARHAVLH
jgi:hypothetical protein